MDFMENWIIQTLGNFEFPATQQLLHSLSSSTTTAEQHRARKSINLDTTETSARPKNSKAKAS